MHVAGRTSHVACEAAHRSSASRSHARQHSYRIEAAVGSRTSSRAQTWGMLSLPAAAPIFCQAGHSVMPTLQRPCLSLSLPPRVLQLVGSAFCPALVTSACFGKQFCGRIRSGARDSLKFLRTDQMVSSHLCDFSSRIFESYHRSDI